MMLKLDVSGEVGGCGSGLRICRADSIVYRVNWNIGTFGKLALRNHCKRVNHKLFLVMTKLLYIKVEQ